MEASGRDVSGDPTPGDAGGGEGVGDKLRDAAEKVKDAVTPDRHDPSVTGGATEPPAEATDPTEPARGDDPLGSGDPRGEDAAGAGGVVP